MTVLLVLDSKGVAVPLVFDEEGVTDPGFEVAAGIGIRGEIG